MTWTPEQIITALSIVAGLFGSTLLTVGGWLVVSKLNKANTEKAKAETVAIYQSMLNESAERESHLVDRVYALERDTEKLKTLLFEKTQENSQLREQFDELKKQKTQENSLLREQFDELKKQSDEQAHRIVDLQSEIDTLRMKRK
jgi:chromosome segregation ATPase